MNLVNGNCVCQNPALNNIQGVCMCSFGTFYIAQINICYPCPNFCETCVQDVSGPVICKSCRQGVNRKNSPESYCLCEDGFKESTPYQIYCCPYRCNTCDPSGCLTCDVLIYRTLQNGDCVCLPGFIENQYGNCVCPSGKTLYNF